MKKDTIKNYCRQCDNYNNHKVVFMQTEESEPDEYHCSTDYYFLSCLGCGTFSFRKDFNDYEAAYPTEDDNWDHPVTTTTFPPSLENHKRLDHIWNLPTSIRTVYEESIKALIADCNILSGAGFRGVIEAICLEKNIKGRTLESKINNLSKEGYITKKECERLHSVRFLGNDSIHEMKVPKRDKLIVVLNIVEHILRNLYLIDYEVDNKLERPINNYNAFKQLLGEKLTAFKIGDEFPIVKFLDRDARLVKENFIEFETALKGEIHASTYNKLQLGTVQPFSGSTNNVQHYIVKDITPPEPLF